MNRRRLGTGGIALLVAVLVVLSVVPGTVAAEQRMGGTVVVTDGETVDGLSAVAGTVVVRGTIEGDLEGVAGTIVVAETGVVTGDLAASAGSVRVDGTVEGRVESGAGSFTLGETGVVAGSVDVGAGAVRLDGTVRGDVTAGADRVVLGPAARLEGDLTVGRGTTLVEREGSSVAGTVDRTRMGGATGVAIDRGTDWLLTAWGFAANLLLGAVLLVAFPRFTGRVAAAVADRPARTGGVGLVTLVGIPLVLVLLVLTIVGIPLAVVLGVPLLVVGGWVALVYGRFAVAAWALGHLGYRSRWAALVAGVVGLGLGGLVPYVGGLVDAVVFVLGLGAVALTLYERRTAREETPPDHGAATPDDGGQSARPA